MSVRNDILIQMADAMCEIAKFEGEGYSSSTAERNAAYLNMDNALDVWAGGNGDHVYMSRKDCLQNMADSLEYIVDHGGPDRSVLIDLIERDVTSIEVAEGTTTIGQMALARCDALVSVVLPSTVTSINSSAFSGCSALETINLPEGLLTISANAFNGCESLTEIVIPDSVSTIGALAFNGCTGITSLTVGSGIQSIANDAFTGITGTITCKFAENTISGAPWGATGATIVYENPEPDPEPEPEPSDAQ